MFLFGFLLYAGLFMAAGIWMNQAQKEYLRLYQTRGNTRRPLVTSDTDPWEFMANPVRLSWNSFRVIWERQRDAMVERVRRRVIHRLWLIPILADLAV